MNPYLKAAIAAAQAGEAVIRHYYESNVKVEIKEDLTPVTVADVETEKVIHEVLSEAFPEFGFFGEETGKSDSDSEYMWLVDPIDGTKGFVRQYPVFSTQIALMKGDEIIAGVSNAPMFGSGEMFYAAQGEGAFMVKDGQTQAIHVSDITTLDQTALSTGNIATMASTSQWKGLGELCTKVNRTRGYGDFLHYHLLASGKIDLIIESDVNILDIAALSIIVKEAGGMFTDFDGNKPLLGVTSVLAAATPDIYDQAKVLLG